MAVSLLERQQTFGAGGLLALRRGAGRVPDIPQNAGVPTNPPISLSQLAGAVKYQPLSISGPTTLSIGVIPLNRPPIVDRRSVSYAVSGGNPGPSVSWAKVGGFASTSIDNAGSLSPTFSATGYVGSPAYPSIVETSTDTWQLTVSDGVSTAQLTLVITVRRDQRNV